MIKMMNLIITFCNEEYAYTVESDVAENVVNTWEEALLKGMCIPIRIDCRNGVYYMRSTNIDMISVTPHSGGFE